MFKQTKRVLAIVLAFVLLFSLVGCGKTSDDDEVSVITEYEYEYVEGEGSGDGNDNVTGTTSKTESGKDKDQGGSGNAKNTVNKDVDPEKYRGKTIKFAATINPAVDESGPVVEAFEKKYGITVEIVQSDQENYANQLAGWISAGKSPDMARCNGDFPTCMGYLQSLTAAKLDYDENNKGFWNQKTLEISTFGGEPYLCDAYNNIWTEVDICVYSKRLLKQAGVRTPEEYDKAGKWTIDTYFDICRAVKALGPNYVGGGFASRENYVYGMGGGLVNYENGQFVNGVNQRTQDAIIKYCEAWKEGIIDWSASTNLTKGTAGIITTHAWVLKKTGGFKDTGYNLDDLGFYYMPRWDENSPYGCTGQVRGWGIVRGAREPVATGIFLRWYLDVNNYDSASTFISQEAENFFYEVTSIDYDNWNPCIVYFDRQDGIAGTTFDEHNNAMSGDPNQVMSAMSSIKSCMERAAVNINKFVKDNTGLK